MTSHPRDDRARLSPLPEAGEAPARVDRVDSPEALGRALARARYANGLTQREVAARLGISQRYVAELEAGKPSLHSERLFAMIRAVGLELRAAAPDPAERLGVGEGWAVRPARADEAQALHELAAATFPLACPPHTTPDAIRAFIDEHLSVAAFERYLADPDREILVFPGHLRIRAGHRRAALRAFAPDDLEPLLGYTMLVHGEPGDEDVRRVVTARPATELSKCYVRAEAHGGGTAHVLMTASIGAARARGARVIWLGVNNENERAQRFYGKHGFERIGEKRFKVGDRYEHDDVLARALA